jgi:predicted TIM-barrel fold metal-dependent hydrolase
MVLDANDRAATPVKLWSNSGDSHFLEPESFWYDLLPKELADRMPRSEQVSEREEIVYVDGTSFHRELPVVKRKKVNGLNQWEIAFDTSRAPGARDPKLRLADADQEGVWGEIIYPSLGLWEYLLKDRKLINTAFRAENDWKVSELQAIAPHRWVPVAHVPILNVEDAVAETERVAELGLHAIGLPTEPPEGIDDWNSDIWEPLWSAAEAAGLVVAIHIGGDRQGVAPYRGPGGAVLNYVETSYGGQRFATKMVSAGVLDRHPELKVLISEAGVTWVPFIGDRMNEAYRLHGMWVKPTLSTLPKEILYRQIYCTFQHDESAPAAMTAMGYRNLLWGSDYPHHEGTYGHTQETLHSLFDGLDEADRHRIMIGTFQELFPHISSPPTSIP